MGHMKATVEQVDLSQNISNINNTVNSYGIPWSDGQRSPSNGENIGWVWVGRDHLEKGMAIRWYSAWIYGQEPEWAYSHGHKEVGPHSWVWTLFDHFPGEMQRLSDWKEKWYISFKT